MISDTVYTKDLIERHNIQNLEAFSAINNFLQSNIGSLVSTRKIVNTLKTEGHRNVSVDTAGNYLSYLVDAFLFDRVQRFDVKSKAYLRTLQKYYCIDLGIRNSMLGFRQLEPTHALEN